ncbi:MAG: hypothetical protein KJ601_01380 [Nanoarchaeota archaeon]|nr:hypothetical protein [Nanoarchaeota archaeon]MBU1703802.1 hypothetical protein [Nanoarchaeota archaeon]
MPYIESLLLDDPGYNQVILKAALEQRLRGSDRPVFFESQFFRYKEAVFEPFRRLLTSQGYTLVKDEYSPSILSIGCSSGKEPYSIAVVSREEGITPRVLAAQLSPSLIEMAKTGSYDIAQTRKELFARDGNPYIPLEHYINQTGIYFQVMSHIKSLVKFVEADILSESFFPAYGKFDFIFCQDFLIYLNDDERTILMMEMGDALTPRGTILLEPIQDQVISSPSQLPENDLGEEIRKYIDFREQVYSLGFEPIGRGNILKRTGS